MTWFLDKLLAAWLAFRGNARIQVRIVDDNAHEPPGILQVEVENIGKSATSLAPTIYVSSYYPVGSRWLLKTLRFDVRELDRELIPFRARLFSATAEEVEAGHLFSWFRTYTLRTTSGQKARVRVRNAALKRASRITFLLDRIAFCITGRLRDDSATSIDVWAADRRARGPH